jgi:hypothetical protein
MDPLATFKAINLIFEGISAWQDIADTLYQRQQKRLAEGRSMTQADLDEIMNQGDVTAALEATKLAAARVAKLGS